MALEILGTCLGFNFVGWSAYHLKYPNWYLLGHGPWGRAIFLGTLRRRVYGKGVRYNKFKS